MSSESEVTGSTPATSPASYKRVKGIFGPDRVLSDPGQLETYSSDATKLTYLPDLVVFPANADELQKLIRVAMAEKIPLVPRGAGTGYTGGALAVKGGIVISFEKMNHILGINAERRIVFTEPGVITYEIAQAAQKAGLFYPPDPASIKISTIGGNVAECAGGLRCKKYGVTKQYVLGLEFVAGTGEIYRTGVLTENGGLGFDFTALLTGSEGTLGFITRIALKLINPPEARRTFLATFASTEKAAAVVAEFTRQGVVPSLVEFVDQDALAITLTYLHKSGFTDAAALLLVEVDGSAGAVEQESGYVLNILQMHALEVRQAVTPEEVEELWLVRREVSTAQRNLFRTKISEDICVPPSRLPEVVAFQKVLAERFGLRVNSFGHAGDGNLHVNFLTNGGVPEERSRIETALEELFDKTLELGGTISGEHGIGVTKSQYLEREVGQAGLELFRKMKAVFDPLGVVNPGKIFFDATVGIGSPSGAY